MGTRSDIIVHRADDKWARIYCHWDGYLDHNGKILFEHYGSQEKAEALVALGDLSVLAPKIGEKHDFDWRRKMMLRLRGRVVPSSEEKRKIEESPKFKRLDKMCLAYGRDRGETGVDAKVFDTLAAAWPPEDTWTEFVYVWDDGQWWVGDPDEGTQTLIDLGDALAGKKTIHPRIKAFGLTLGRH